jgi:RNA polymerase sigma-70 factor (ECF subfamily)
MSDDPEATGKRPDETFVDPASTVELLERVRKGDMTALDSLFARHAAPLRRWASGRLPRAARELIDTDDLVQDALLQTFKRINDFEFRGSGGLFAYLRRAVINRIRDELRRKGRRPEAETLDDWPGDETSPLDHAIGREMMERYERALSRLKEGEQEAIIARVEMGYSYEELADALGKPSPEAARKAAQRALIRLAQEMADDAG